MYISEKYKELNKQAHVQQKGYGANGKRRAGEVLSLIHKHNVMSGLDYGCGKGSLSKSISCIEWQEYDPAIEGKDTLPKAAELVVCHDVLEHVEIEFLDNVLQHLEQLTEHVLSVIISLREGGRTLPNGQKAHCTVLSPQEWVTRFYKNARKSWKDLTYTIDKEKGELKIIIVYED